MDISASRTGLIITYVQFKDDDHPETLHILQQLAF